VARFAAQQKVQEATDAARELGEMMLARYAWVSTRRWMVATITAFVASIAALAGSALLFQQNQLLRSQGVLMQEQTDRLTEQTALLNQQIELGEAERSASIVPEILDIGAAIGVEVNQLAKDGREVRIFQDDELSPALRGRIVAATTAARPYRYLSTEVARASDNHLASMALERRQDVPQAREAVEKYRNAVEQMGILPENGTLIDRPVSPERGQLLSIFYNARVMSTVDLTLKGADFSFAEVRMPAFGVISMRHALLRFSDFSGVDVRQGEFGAAYLEQARFVSSIVSKTDFSGVKSEDLPETYLTDASLPIWPTEMAGADFRAAVITDSKFNSINGLAINFDFTLMNGDSFKNASIVASTFRLALIGENDFTGANLDKTDFDEAFVFSEDFLDTLAAQAMPGTFDKNQYKLEPAEMSLVETHFNALHLYHIAGYMEGTAKVWQIKRVAASETPEN
jgi:uncharacterized protein YjbI with pentapeptide repeats